MIKFTELKPIIDEVTDELKEIVSKMKSYSKIDVDYRAGALIDEVNAKIKQINSVYNNVYSIPEFKDLYGANSNYDYTEYVKMIKAEVARFEAIYQRIKKFETVTGYYSSNPFSNNSESEPEK